MAIIAPFNGFTYNYYARQDFEAIVAPPYDVISGDEQETYYQKDPYNVIRLILAKKKIGDSDWDNRYTRAADCFKRWESAGILIPSDRPCIYLTSLSYDPGNGDPRRTRWGIILLVRIEDEDAGVILPHERTFSAHRDDRLKLMRACSAQLSQIFGLYEEPDNTIMEAARKVTDFSPEIAFDFEDGTNHRMWVIQNPRVFKTIADAMSDKSIFIADGHHRYETARNYRNMMRARHGRRPLNRSYEYVMMYLSNMSDEGLTILPSHRLIKEVPDLQPGPLLEKVGPWFDITSFPFEASDSLEECTALKQNLLEAGRLNTAIGFYHTKASQCHLLSLKPGVRDQLGDDLHSSLKKLDVLVLSRFILQKGIGFTKQDLDDDEIIGYQSSMRTAVSQVQSGDYQMAFLLNPTRIDQVKGIAKNSLVMPRKSTYFYPKILSGLVFNKINPNEIIQVP
ncbi:MAG: DUF1015 domain-containing protein [Deltaproteobacteria bacterium]|nr:DUF1015 domain-containing protein [Deltaproteobacteria bacterium]